MRGLKVFTYIVFLSTAAAIAPAWAQTPLKNAQFLEKSGWAAWTSTTTHSMLNGANSAVGITADSDFRPAWQSAAKAVYRSNKLIEFVDEGIEKELSASEKQELMAYYNLPLGKRVIERQNVAYFAPYEKYPKNLEPFRDRIPLYNAMYSEDAHGLIASILEYEMILKVGKNWAESGHFYLDTLRVDVSNQRTALLNEEADWYLKFYAYAYSSFSEEELKVHIAFLKTPAAKKLHNALPKWVDQGMLAQIREFDKQMHKNLRDAWTCSNLNPCRGGRYVGRGLADVWKFDIGGVRLHMSGPEAIGALKAKFGASIPVEEKARGTFSLKNEIMQNVITYITCESVLVEGKKFVCGVAYGHATGQYSVYFVERLPGEDDRRPEIATSIELTPGNVHTDADWDQFLLAVTDKYGMPTKDDEGISAHWCVTGACRNPELVLYKNRSLHFRSLSLSLKDSGYHVKVDVAERAKQHVLKATKPPL
jgi:hypothetical protein